MILHDIFYYFGMSETTGPHTLSIPTEFTFSGSRVDGSSRTIIDDPDPTGEGEVRIHMQTYTVKDEDLYNIFSFLR